MLSPVLRDSYSSNLAACRTMWQACGHRRRQGSMCIPCHQYQRARQDDELDVCVRIFNDALAQDDSVTVWLDDILQMQERYTGETALHIAARYHWIQTCTVLSDHGGSAASMRRDKMGRTAVDTALDKQLSGAGWFECCTRLTRYGGAVVPRPQPSGGLRLGDTWSVLRYGKLGRLLLPDAAVRPHRV